MMISMKLLGTWIHQQMVEYRLMNCFSIW